MPKKPPAEGALFVRLPAAAVEKLDRAAEALGMRKKDLVAGLIHKLGTSPGEPLSTVGSYSFQPYDPPEVMNTAQAAQYLQIEESVVIAMAEAGELPGRRLGDVWRFSRAALVAWLAKPEKR
ncbi:MAG TPA: helix-turn-helix domain-containing protein [Polyangia bacterium]|jgi:excisionase family DNA binding protein